MRISWPFRTLALAVAATAACRVCPDQLDQELAVESQRTLTVVCWQTDGGNAFRLSDAGMGRAEARIELRRKDPAKVWFNGEQSADYYIGQTSSLAWALIKENTQDVSIHVFDETNHARSFLSIISQASSVCEKANVIFKVKYQFVYMDFA